MKQRNSIEFKPLIKKMSDLSSFDSMEEGSGESPSYHSSRTGHQMAIFYDGKIGAYDLTELQARAILLLASHDTEQRMFDKEGEKEEAAVPLRASFQQRLCKCNPVNGVSMKRSLQRFLQKRKLRAQARLPY